jgi:hypothetical protein
MVNSNSNLFVEQGKSSVLPQYDDVTLKNMELINAVSVLRNSIVFNLADNTIFQALKEFHFYFCALRDTTFIEIDKYINQKEREVTEKRINDVLFLPLSSNRKLLILRGKECIEVFEIYQILMRKAGFRKISYFTLNEAEKFRENI